ncbi:MAG: hypothetical protein JNK05_34845 [Myxococcales bacterium]|nr:hypothetical protein [Myxococcales bacterium]
MREQVFQNRLLVALSKIEGVRVWRQNAGKVVARRGAVKGAPKGAADITGIIAPEGWRIEIEVKASVTGITRQQIKWLETMRERGAVVLVARYREELSAEENIAAVCESLTESIVTRRKRG